MILTTILSTINFAPDGGFKGVGRIGLENESSSDSPQLFNDVISLFVGVMTVVAIIWFLIQLFIGGLGIISAGGDKSKIEESRQKIINSIIGIVVIIAAVFLVDLVGQLLGITDILNPATFIENGTI